jgi:uncharacterized protein YkuJ
VKNVAIIDAYGFGTVYKIKNKLYDELFEEDQTEETDMSRIEKEGKAVCSIDHLLSEEWC